MLAKAKEKGFTMILVMWATTLISVIAVSFIASSKTVTKSATHISSDVKYKSIAFAVLNMSMLELMSPKISKQWIPPVRNRDFNWNGYRVRIEIDAESGKIDLNHSPKIILLGIHEQFFDVQKSKHLVDALMDWKDKDDRQQKFGAEDEEYISAGYAYTPRNKQFLSTKELKTVFGYGQLDQLDLLLPHLTVYSKRSRANFFHSSQEVLSAIPGLTNDTIRRILEFRDTINSNQAKTLVPKSSQRYFDFQNRFNTVAIKLSIVGESGDRNFQQIIVKFNSNRTRFRIVDWQITNLLTEDA